MRVRHLIPFILVIGCSSKAADSAADGSVPEDSSSGETSVVPEASADASSEGSSEAATDAGTSPSASCSLADLHMKYAGGASDLDLDCDGKADWHVTRSGGTVVTETMDVNGDGKPDLKLDRGSTPMRLEVDSNLDGKIDLVVERSPGSEPDSFDFVELRDPSLRTGVMSFRRSWTIDPAVDTVEYVEELLDADGVTWNEDQRTTSPLRAPKISGTVNTSGAGACSDGDKMKLESALDQIDKSIDCLSKYDSGLAWRTRWMLAVSGVELSCVPGDGKYCGAATSLDKGCTFGFCGTITIDVTKDGLSNPACGSLGTTLFHEIMHYVEGGHHNGGGEQDANDPVWGCEKLCGDPSKPANANNCAACLQTSSGDKRCADLPRDCKLPPERGHCNCDKATMEWYDTYTACTVGCPSGIACFASNCARVPGPPQCEMEGAPCKCGCCPGLTCDAVSKKCEPM